MKLNNFTKSTAELRPDLILKGDQQQSFFISGIIINSNQKEILLSLTSTTSELPLSQFRTKTAETCGDFRIFLFDPKTNLKTPTFGYYLRDQYIVIK